MAVGPIQLLEYQRDVWRCRFDTLEKLTPAHCAGAPTAWEVGVPELWVGVNFPIGINLPIIYSRHKCTGNLDLGLMPVVTTIIGTSGATMNSETIRTSEACISLRLPNAHLSRSPATKSLVTPLLAPPFPPDLIVSTFVLLCNPFKVTTSSL